MSTENNCTPRLRFPGFTSEWNLRKLGEIGDTYSGLSGKSKEDFEKGDAKFITFMNVMKNVRVDTNILGIVNVGEDERQNLVKQGDLLFNTSSETPEEVGFCSVYNSNSDDKVYLNSFCFGYRLKNQREYYPLYIAYFFRSDCGRELMNRIAQGITRYNLSKEYFNKAEIPFPSFIEQEKIAACLAEIDDLIMAQSGKIDALRVETNGLLQQLFPRDGETSPRMRLAGCSGDWEEKRLGDVCDNMLVGFPFKGQDITNDKSGHPILRAYSIGTGCIMHGEGYDKYFPHDAKALEKYMVRSGDIVIAMDGSVGRNIAMVSDAEDGFLLIQRVARLRIKDYPIQLIYQQIISQRFKDFASAEKVGSIISHISQKQIESFPIYLPFSKDEQKKIAECLSALDDQIAAESAKLEALKDHKRGLMQQLFPQPAN